MSICESFQSKIRTIKHSRAQSKQILRGLDLWKTVIGFQGGLRGFGRSKEVISEVTDMKNCFTKRMVTLGLQKAMEQVLET